MKKIMRMPGFTAEAMLQQNAGVYQVGPGETGTRPEAGAEPAFRCNGYLLAKCLIFGEGDCYDKYCPIVQ